MLRLWRSTTVPERSTPTSYQHGEFIIINNNTKTSILTYQLMLTNFIRLGVSTVETNRDRDRERPTCRD
jgi:hypothetical protein